MRNTIINYISSDLEKNPSVNALWLEGADAHSRVDEYSDIDLWMDVTDGKESEILYRLEIILSNIGVIDFSYEQPHPHKKIRQKFFHLQNTSEYLVIDVCVQSHSRIFRYTKEYKDEKVKILFDKTNVVMFKTIDKEKFDKRIADEIDDLKKTFVFFQVRLKKSLQRNLFLESVWMYHEKVLKPLVKLLRLRFESTKHEHYLKDASADIPQKYLSILEDVYKITSIVDIKQKMLIANKLFEELVN